MGPPVSAAVLSGRVVDERREAPSPGVPFRRGYVLDGYPPALAANGASTRCEPSLQAKVNRLTANAEIAASVAELVTITSSSSGTATIAIQNRGLVNVRDLEGDDGPEVAPGDADLGAGVGSVDGLVMMRKSDLRLINFRGLTEDQELRPSWPSPQTPLQCDGRRQRRPGAAQGS